MLIQRKENRCRGHGPPQGGALRRLARAVTRGGAPSYDETVGGVIVTSPPLSGKSRREYACSLVELASALVPPSPSVLATVELTTR
jgi:hypothetical protein